MDTILKGDWTSNDYHEIRHTDTCKICINNSSNKSEHIITLQMYSPSIMKIQIESEKSTTKYFLELLSKDLLVPLYMQVSLLWLKLLFGKAIRGETRLNLYYITHPELKVNLTFLPNSFTPSECVNDEDAAAIAFEVSYELNGEIVKICLQVPRTMESGWFEGTTPIELEMWGESSELLQKNKRLQKRLLSLQQKNAFNVKKCQKSQKELMNSKLDLN